MRPKKLIINAFGPYADEEQINFEELGSRTMFVISGKTGAGKTTIFDAIAFALYGKTSGEERSGQDLRSDFAEENRLTSVDFIFSLKDRIYRIKRSPIQSRKKTRGEGFTTVSAKAEIYEIINGEEKLLGTTLSESEEQINKLMQLDFHQFKQILMIPQGEFRTLLTSDSTDKERILQKLFHTESYRFFQEYLKNKSKELREYAAGFLKDRERYFQAIDPLDHMELTEALNQELKNDELIIKLAKDLVATQKDKMVNERKNIINQKEKFKELLKKIENAHFIEKAFIDLQHTNEELTRLKNNKPEIIYLEDKLRISREAEAIWPNFKELQTKENEIEQRKKYRNEVKEQLTTVHDKYEKLKQEMEILKEQKNEIMTDERELAELVAVQGKLEKYILKFEELKQHAASGKTEKDKLDHLKDQLTAYEKAKTDLSEEQQKRYEYQARSADLKVKLSQLNDFIKIVKEIEHKGSAMQSLIQEMNSKKESVKLVSVNLNKEQSLLDHAIQEQSLQHAFELGDQLIEGEACPVCGSTQHPDPAIVKGSKIDTEQFQQNIQSYRAEKIRNESSIEYLKERIAEMDHDIKNLTEIKKTSDYYNENSDLEDYKALSIKFEIEQQKLLKVIELKDPSVEMKQTEQNISSLNQQIKKLEIFIQNKRDDYITSRSVVNQLKEEIPEIYLNKEHLLNQIKVLQNKTELYNQQFKRAEEEFIKSDKEFNRLSERLNQAEAEVGNTEKILKDVSDRFIYSLNQSSFNKIDDLVSAKLDEHERVEMEKKISSYEKKVFSLQEYANKLENDLEHISQPDIKGLEEEKEVVESDLQLLEEKNSRLTAYIQQHEQLLHSLIENIDASGEVEKHYLLTGHLSDIANGQNELKLTFERFVLAYYLEDILIVANERLLKMTSGRYELHRKEDRSRGNKQGGLELLVMDHYTGQQRHVKTLSGGEAFKASLSLALGLADVVQSYAGGVSLETMFIDEGFGTLDPESLDQAIESLMDVQSSGRLVGVISHVPELKERIDARLEVFSTKGGSSTKFIFESQ